MPGWPEAPGLSRDTLIAICEPQFYWRKGPQPTSCSWGWASGYPQEKELSEIYMGGKRLWRALFLWNQTPAFPGTPSPVPAKKEVERD